MTTTAADRQDRIRLGQLRRGITPKLRHFILDGASCDYCGFPATEVDHIVPVSRGGGVALANLAASCVECNSEKRDQTVEEWAAWRRSKGLPWPVPAFSARLVDFLSRHNVTAAEVGDDIPGWIRRWPGGYEAIRAEFVAARNHHDGGAQ